MAKYKSKEFCLCTSGNFLCSGITAFQLPNRYWWGWAGSTGAPFVANGLYCTECHGGGNFGASITVELIDAASNLVATYNPAETYSLRITLGHTTGLPKFGFQVMAVTSNDEKDLNNWGTVPHGTHSVAVGGRHYIELSNPTKHPAS